MVNLVVKYECNGKCFDKYEDALEYDSLCERINSIMSILPGLKYEGDVVCHDIDSIKCAYCRFCKICLEKYPLGVETIEREISYCHPNRETNFHYIVDMLSSSDYPILSDTYFRFRCICFSTGYEFTHPCYVKDPKKYFEDYSKGNDIAVDPKS